MKIIIITQDNPLFIADSINRLLISLKKKHEITGCIVSSPSPFGKKESFFKKAYKTFHIFGFIFFIRYSLIYLLNRFVFSKNLKSILKENSVKQINLSKSVNHHESIELIRSFSPDLIISLAGNEIFKTEFINIPKKGCINLHTALLPKYRGLMPAFWVLKNNEKKTGVSVFFVDEGIDSGDIIIQKTIDINNLSHSELIKKTKILGVEAIIEAVEKIDDNSYKLIENNDDLMSYYSFPTREDVLEFKRKKKRFF